MVLEICFGWEIPDHYQHIPKKSEVINQKPFEVEGRLIPYNQWNQWVFNDVISSSILRATASELSTMANDGIVKANRKEVHLSEHTVNPYFTIVEDDSHGIADGGGYIDHAGAKQRRYLNLIWYARARKNGSNWKIVNNKYWYDYRYTL